MTRLTLRGVYTADALIAQAALETLGFKTLNEIDTPEAYMIEMEVPEKYAHITKEIEIMDGLGRKKTIITT
jgi:hypothetical protein